jgi:hypothetical protein
MEKNKWFYVALGSLAVSILSLFVSVITYTMPNGVKTSYNILDFFKGERFVREVLVDYRGHVFWRIDSASVRILAVLALGALIMSVVGICTMRAQRPRTWQFVMALVGLAGTAIPSLLIFYAVFQSSKGFAGQIRIGIAPVIMPISAVISIIAVTYRRNSALKEMERLAREQNLIWEAGDMMEMNRTVVDYGQTSRQGRLQNSARQGRLQNPSAADGNRRQQSGGAGRDSGSGYRH